MIYTRTSLQTSSPTNRKVLGVLSQEAESKLVEFGQMLTIARKQRHWSVQECARRIGVDRRTLTALESGSPSVPVGIVFNVLSIFSLLRGIEEVVRPENDIVAIHLNVQKARRYKSPKHVIPDKKVKF